MTIINSDQGAGNGADMQKHDRAVVSGDDVQVTMMPHPKNGCTAVRSAHEFTACMISADGSKLNERVVSLHWDRNGVIFYGRNNYSGCVPLIESVEVIRAFADQELVITTTTS